jgi:hypothetical protein
MKPRSTGVPTSAIPSAQGGLGALDEGRALLMRNDPVQALSAFQVALAQAPDSVAALNGMAIAYDRLGRSDLARQHFEMALALEPDAPDIAYNLGLALLHAGKDRAAIASLQRAAAGPDARVAAAARRNLTQIAARLTAVEQADAAPVATGPRIDMASNGEAVLVLAPASPHSAAVFRTASDVPDRIDGDMAGRLGEVATLTIPISVAEAIAEAAETAVDTDADASDDAMLPPPRRMAVAHAVPAMPEPPAEPAPAAIFAPDVEPAAVTVQRARPAQLVRAQWRRAEPANSVRSVDPRPLLASMQLHDDGKDGIRAAIARLESLIALIEVQRG